MDMIPTLLLFTQKKRRGVEPLSLTIIIQKF